MLESANERVIAEIIDLEGNEQKARNNGGVIENGNDICQE